MEEDGPVAAHLVTPYLFPTGTWIYDQIRSLERYRPVVLTSKLENLDRFPFDTIELLPALPESRRSYARPANTLAALSRPRALTRALRGTAVAHAHFGPEGCSSMSAARAARVPLVVSFYGYDLTQLPTKFPAWRTRYQRLFEAARAVLVEGSHMRDVLIELGCPPSRAIVQRLGVDLDAIPFSERRRSGPVRALLAATLREKKGVQYALEALAKSRSGGLDIELTLIGEGPDEAAIARSIEDLGLQEAVSRRPYVAHDELVAEYGRHDILIQPSVTALDGDTEGGLPVTIIEAAASGMPIVATTHCDIPDAVVGGRGGILVPERDSAALAAALVDLACRAGEWPAMGMFNRQRVTDLYDLSTQIGQLESIYDDVGA